MMFLNAINASQCHYVQLKRISPYVMNAVTSLPSMSNFELATKSSGGGNNENEGSGVLLQMPSTSSESCDENLTPEELLYLKVYQHKLEDGGFVQDEAPPSTPPPWQLRHKSSVLSQLRLIRWLAFLVCFGIGAGSGIYLLVQTIQVISTLFSC
jgi:hypothetical protein